MARGGARNRSGPQPDPTSGRSDARGLQFDKLPAAGFKGRIPKFPLPEMRRYVLEPGEVRGQIRIFDQDTTDLFREREIEVWKNAWRTPQAAAWAEQAWRHQIIAEYCRVKTAVEMEPEASAALIGQLHRFRDQIGLTPAGMRENGWQIAAAEPSAARAATAPAAAATAPAPTRRLRAV